jgi:ArsR family transcriptional regulator, arsenate/arsenite/antimonite-responsive transcriptional repressor
MSFDILTGVDMNEPSVPPIDCCAPLGAPRLTEDEADATAELFKALADPARVQIVNRIARARGAVCACDFNELVGLSQPTVSHHLKKLTDAGLLEREQRGKWAYFSLTRDAVDKLAAVADLKGACC